jgi:hypothetical protein
MRNLRIAGVESLFERAARVNKPRAICIPHMGGKSTIHKTYAHIVPINDVEIAFRDLSPEQKKKLSTLERVKYGSDEEAKLRDLYFAECYNMLDSSLLHMVHYPSEAEAM